MIGSEEEAAEALKFLLEQPKYRGRELGDIAELMFEDFAELMVACELRATHSDLPDKLKDWTDRILNEWAKRQGLPEVRPTSDQLDSEEEVSG